MLLRTSAVASCVDTVGVDCFTVEFSSYWGAFALEGIGMTKNSLWSEKQNNRRSKPTREYEGGAERLLQYADTHPSARELAKLKIKAELRRWGIEQRPPTVEEIQQRYNFTVEYAEKFLKKLEKARSLTDNKPAAKVVKPVERGIAPPTLLAVKPVEQKGVEGNGVVTEPAQLKVILAGIRGRYGEEIRQKGEQTSVREGFVYLATNPCFPGWVKAGMTIDYELRLGTYNTSDPLSRFEYVKLAWTPDRRDAERLLLTALQRTAAETRGEWFRMLLQEAIIIFDSCKRIP